MRTYICAATLSLVLNIGFTFAAGKIVGTVAGRSSGSPIAGATVSIDGNNRECFTDTNGYYAFLAVPHGVYELTVRAEGYQTVLIPAVSVRDGLTSRADCACDSLGTSEKVLEVDRRGEPTAARSPGVIRSFTGIDVLHLPIRGVERAFLLTPGIVEQDGLIHARSGREDEIGYAIETANTRNVLDGTNLAYVIPEALEELQFRPGSYPAEYGGGNSGIVSQTLKSGTKEFAASLRVETDNFTPQHEKQLGTYSYGYSDYVLTLGGPLFTDKVRGFLAAENRFDRDSRVIFWDGFKKENLLSDAYEPDTIQVLDVKPGNVPASSRNFYALNGTLTFDDDPFFLRLSGGFSHGRRQGTSAMIKNILDVARVPVMESSTLLLSGKLTHRPGPNLYYEVGISYLDNRGKTVDPLFGDDFLSYYDSLANASMGYQFRWYTSSPYFRGYFYGFDFANAGVPLAMYEKNLQSRIGVSFDIAMQIDGEQELKTGFSFERGTVRFFNSTSSPLLQFYRAYPDMARTPSAERDLLVQRYSASNHYGYDTYGNLTDDGIDGPKHPLFWAAYIQDHVVLSNVIIDVGLRLDVFDFDIYNAVNDPTFAGFTQDMEAMHTDPDALFVLPASVSKQPPFATLSPRLGISTDAGGSTLFHAAYADLRQAPALGDMYSGWYSLASRWTSSWRDSRIPTTLGIVPQKTTLLEAGFTHYAGDVATFDITGFYRDDERITHRSYAYLSPSPLAEPWAALWESQGSRVTGGIEVAFRLHRWNRLQADVNYTWESAQGTDPLHTLFESTSWDTLQKRESGYPLDYLRTHRGSVNLDYRFGMDEGGPILGGLGVNLLFTFSSGHPYTRALPETGGWLPSMGDLAELAGPSERTPSGDINSWTTPAIVNFDVRLDKMVTIGPLSADFYVYVQNLFNRKNIINVYMVTGEANNDGFLGGNGQWVVDYYGNQFVDLYNKINIANGEHYRRVTGKELWGPPRQIRFGVKVEY